MPVAADPAPVVPLLVVMGVSGSGKTTFGAALGERPRVPFADADRRPWLRAIGAWLAGHAHGTPEATR